MVALRQPPELTDKQLAWLALPQWDVRITRIRGGRVARVWWGVRAATFDDAAELVDARLGERPDGEVRTVEITPLVAAPGAPDTLAA